MFPAKYQAWSYSGGPNLEHRYDQLISSYYHFNSQEIKLKYHTN